MNTVLLFLMLFQNGDYSASATSVTDAQRRETRLREVATREPSRNEAEVSANAYAAARNDEFVAKFNKLIVSLIDFAESYRNKQAMDVKKAVEIRKAWLELEKAEPLFREDPKK